MSVKRDTVVALAVAAMGVIAVAIAAATLEDRWYPEEEGTGAPGDNGDGIGGPLPEPETGDGITIPYIDEILLFLIVLVAIFGLIYLIKNHREYLVPLAVLIGVSAILFVLLSWIDPSFSQAPMQEDGDWFPDYGGDNGETAPPEAQVDWLPVAAVIAILGLVLIAAIALSVRDSAPTIERSSEPESTSRRPGLAADIGDAAGRAADRIEASETYENEVYRAWAEMTELLDLPNPEVATPRDFAGEAVEAGLEPADIRDLTRLFEAVRYGNRPPTETREQRAVDCLRRIERRYAGSD